MPSDVFRMEVSRRLHVPAAYTRLLMAGTRSRPELRFPVQSLTYIHPKYEDIRLCMLHTYFTSANIKYSNVTTCGQHLRTVVLPTDWLIKTGQS
jgi:hypothetical protein